METSMANAALVLVVVAMLALAVWRERRVSRLMHRATVLERMLATAYTDNAQLRAELLRRMGEDEHTERE